MLAHRRTEGKIYCAVTTYVLYFVQRNITKFNLVYKN